MKRTITALLLLCGTIIGCNPLAPAFAQTNVTPAPAAAKDLSNVDPATGRTALGAAATSTVSAHTGATNGVHGAPADGRLLTASDPVPMLNAENSWVANQSFPKITLYSPGANFRHQRIPIAVSFPAEASGVATLAFSIKTVNEGGSTSGGAYVCKFKGLVSNGGLLPSEASAGLTYLEIMFTRSVVYDGSIGTTSPITTILEGGGATTTGGRLVTDVTVTTAESSEFSNNVLFQIYCGGTDGAIPYIYGEIDIYSTFLSTPTVVLRP